MKKLFEYGLDFLRMTKQMYMMKKVVAGHTVEEI